MSRFWAHFISNGGADFASESESAGANTRTGS